MEGVDILCTTYTNAKELSLPCYRDQQETHTYDPDYSRLDQPTSKARRTTRWDDIDSVTTLNDLEAAPNGDDSEFEDDDADGQSYNII